MRRERIDKAGFVYLIEMLSVLPGHFAMEFPGSARRLHKIGFDLL
jgi:hypothetical protein